jgi:predicted DNA-binding protein
MADKQVKKTHSFRCSPSLWEMVKQTAKEQDRQTTEIITDAISKYVGKYVREDTNLSEQQMLELLSKVDNLNKELVNVEKVIKDNKKLKGKK